MSDQPGKPRTEKEAIFDEQIAPLWEQIYDICLEHDIAVHAVYDLGQKNEGKGHTLASSCNYDEDKGHSSVVTLLHYMVREGAEAGASLFPTSPIFFSLPD